MLIASVVDVDVVVTADVVEGRVVVDEMTGSVIGEIGGGMSIDASSCPLPLPRVLPSYLGFWLLPPSTKKLMM